MGVLRSAALVAWAAFFDWLWLSGEASRYVGARTHWVVVFGAIALSTATAVRVVGLGGRRTPEPAGSWREVAGPLVVLVPLAALLAVPAPDLGAAAASRREAPRGLAALGAAAPTVDREGPVGLIDVEHASVSADYAAARGVRDGSRLDVLGFVRRPEAPVPGTSFELTRFLVYCCAADAVPYSVPVRAPPLTGGAPQEDAWVRVRGVLERRGERFVLVAESVAPIAEPGNPYL